MCRLTSRPILSCKFRRANSGIRISYSNAPTASVSVSPATATGVPVILVIMGGSRAESRGSRARRLCLRQIIQPPAPSPQPLFDG